MKKLKYLTPKEFENIYSKVPRLCVDVIIKTYSGIILTKRTIEPARGMWHIPGSTLLKNENLKDAVNRISISELGVSVAIDKLLGIIEYRYNQSNYNRHDISVVFLAHPRAKNFQLKIDKNASDVGIFKKFPKNTLKQQVDFIKQYKILV